jgi:serine/threonine-protein kinase
MVGQLLRNKWKVLERVGSGSFGTVYKVQDVKGGWIDALKILSVDRMVGMDAEHARKRFLREAQLVKRLGKDSPHIVGLSTYEEDLESGLIYFLMDFVEGDSLGEVVRNEGPFSPERAVHLALQVCDALMVAHEGGEPVVHRDLKLENIMLTRGRGGEEIAKVLDFGIAKIAEREQDSRLTEAGTSLGTPGFAAPEQLRAGPVDARTDLFAFGVILYTVLTGRDPWLGEPAGESTGKIYELMVASERGAVRPIEETGVEVPPALAEIVLKLLCREPDDRFSSARGLKEALEGVVLPSAGPIPTIQAPPKKAPARRPWDALREVGPIPLAAGAVGVLLVIALLLVRPWGRTLALPDLQARAVAGQVSRVRLGSDGMEGSLSVLGFLPVPFRVSVDDAELPRAVGELRGVGVEVDANWVLHRLLQQAVQAQSETRYFGFDGDDVKGYAERMVALEPESPEARSLLLKVAERMAWDAEAAFEAGSTGVAQNLLRECRALVPNHPRCEAVAAGR